VSERPSTLLITMLAAGSAILYIPILVMIAT
jgi:hypothetical protein